MHCTDKSLSAYAQGILNLLGISNESLTETAAKQPDVYFQNQKPPQKW